MATALKWNNFHVWISKLLSLSFDDNNNIVRKIQIVKIRNKQVLPIIRCCLSGCYGQVLSLWLLQAGVVSLVATARCCLFGRYRQVQSLWSAQTGAVSPIARQVLSLWSLQSGAVSLVATDRCCLFGRYRQVLSLWSLVRCCLSISNKLLHTLSQPKVQRDKRIVYLLCQTSGSFSQQIL